MGTWQHHIYSKGRDSVFIHLHEDYSGARCANKLVGVAWGKVALDEWLRVLRLGTGAICKLSAYFTLIAYTDASQGSAKDFPKTKEQYVNWGDFDDDGSQSRRFKGVPLEPHTEPISVK